MNNLIYLTAVLFGSSLAWAENPLVRNIFTADPAARVFGDRVYVYTSHDERDAGHFDMFDWQLLSSSDLVSWKHHGTIFGLKDFTWATKWAWAPDCIAANGKYFLFLPVDRVKIGVAVGDKPEGPFKDAIGQPLLDNASIPEAGKEPIDPALFADDNGDTYLYFGCREPRVVKLEPSMTKFAGALQPIALLYPDGKPIPRAMEGKGPVLPEGYGEAPFVFKRAGKYYFVYSNGWAPQSCLVYATGDTPIGPFTYAGKVMEHVPGNTQHGSIIQFRGKWYVFYHTNELSGGNNFRRAVCMDELSFDADGRIKTVTATRMNPSLAPASSPTPP